MWPSRAPQLPQRMRPPPSLGLSRAQARQSLQCTPSSLPVRQTTPRSLPNLRPHTSAPVQQRPAPQRQQQQSSPESLLPQWLSRHQQHHQMQQRASISPGPVRAQSQPALQPLDSPHQRVIAPFPETAAGPAVLPTCGPPPTPGPMKTSPPPPLRPVPSHLAGQQSTPTLGSPSPQPLPLSTAPASVVVAGTLYPVPGLTVLQRHLMSDFLCVRVPCMPACILS